MIRDNETVCIGRDHVTPPKFRRKTTRELLSHRFVEHLSLLHKLQIWNFVNDIRGGFDTNNVLFILVIKYLTAWNSIT